MISFSTYNIPDELSSIIKDFLSKLEKNLNIELLSTQFSQLQTIEINFLTQSEIQKLNLQYRNINKPTDVLSFNLTNIGELDLSLDIIHENALSLSEDFHQEIFRCIIHGCLHIFGYDHVEKLIPETLSQEEMFIIQEKILTNVSSSSL